MLKLSRISISGFKAVDRFNMAVSPNITLLVGMNGAGKSSILQALAFARNCVEDNVYGFFGERDWDRRALKFRSSKHRGTVVFITTMFDSDEYGKIGWRIGWGLNRGVLYSEKLQIKRSKDHDIEDILTFSSKDGGRIGEEKFPSLTFSGSVLSAVESLDIGDHYKGIVDVVRRWFLGVQSLELLSPAAMKGGTRYSPTTMGGRGERLAGFLASLTAEQKSRVMGRLGRFYPISEIETVRKRAGWIDLILTERYEGLGSVRSPHMSDGFMRLLALCAIPELDNAVSLVLLDEIEDGIEPHILNDLITMVAKESSAQIIATSHSPLLANTIGIENIRFISRDNEGRTIAAEAAAMPAFQKGADFFGPGELWTNTERKVLQTQALANSSSDTDKSEADSL